MHPALPLIQLIAGFIGFRKQLHQLLVSLGFATDAASCLVGFVLALLEVHLSQCIAELSQ